MPLLPLGHQIPPNLAETAWKIKRGQPLGFWGLMEALDPGGVMGPVGMGFSMPRKAAKLSLDQFRILLRKEPERYMSIELQRLHKHTARLRGLIQSGDRYAKDFLKGLAQYSKRANPARAELAEQALNAYWAGDIKKATQLSEMNLQYLHMDELADLTEDRIVRLYKDYLKGQ